MDILEPVKSVNLIGEQKSRSPRLVDPTAHVPDAIILVASGAGNDIISTISIDIVANTYIETGGAVGVVTAFVPAFPPLPANAIGRILNVSIRPNFVTFAFDVDVQMMIGNSGMALSVLSPIPYACMSPGQFVFDFIVNAPTDNLFILNLAMASGGSFAVHNHIITITTVGWIY